MIKLAIGQRKKSFLLPILPSSGRAALLNLQRNRTCAEAELVMCGFSLTSPKHTYNELLIMHVSIAFQ